MDVDQMSSEVARFFNDANALQWKKNRDYHPDNVAFLEILRTACECGVTVEQDLWGKIRKQYVALRSFVIDGKLESESPESRMTDIAVYMGMFAFWTKHREQILRDATVFISNHAMCENDRAVACHRLNSVVPICDQCKFLFWLQDHAR